MTTLMLSSAPQSTSKPTESGNEVEERPKAMVAETEQRDDDQEHPPGPLPRR